MLPGVRALSRARARAFCVFRRRRRRLACRPALNLLLLLAHTLDCLSSLPPQVSHLVTVETDAVRAARLAAEAAAAAPRPEWRFVH